jgi:hypothetical protein
LVSVIGAGLRIALLWPENLLHRHGGRGQIEVLADERSRFVKASLSREHELVVHPSAF